MMREAADIVEQSNALPQEQVQCKFWHFSQYARVLASNDEPRALKLLRFSPPAREILKVVNNVVELVDPLSFAARFDELKRTFFAHKVRSESRNTRKVAGRAEGLERVARRWSPLGKLIKLAGILVPVASVELRAAARPERAVRAHWAPTFSVPIF